MSEELLKEPNNDLNELSTKLKNFITQVKAHHYNGHNELSVIWILNYFKEDF
jgi:hypothetical protein